MERAKATTSHLPYSNKKGGNDFCILLKYFLRHKMTLFFHRVIKGNSEIWILGLEVQYPYEAMIDQEQT